MMLLSWILEILETFPCTGPQCRQNEGVKKGPEDDDADDRTWCSTQWIGGLKATLKDDVTLATRDDFTLATKEDMSVATSQTEAMSEKS